MTQFEIVNAKLDRILARLGEPADPVVPTPPAPPTPPVPTPPVPPSGPNPFVAWKAEGLSLYDVILYKLHHGLSEREWEQAVAAGYASEAGLRPSGGGPAMPTGNDLTGTERGGGVRNILNAGLHAFIWTAPKDGAAYWTFEINGGPVTAKNVVLDGAPRDLHDWIRTDFVAVAGRTHIFTVQIDGTAPVAITVRYSI
jgi:hypothetical protein